MVIFQIVAAIINIVFMILVFIMPVWIPALILKIKYKKDNITVLTNDEEIKKIGLWHFLFNKDKFIWLNSVAAIILVYLGYMYNLNSSCEEMQCLGKGFLLIPFILSFITIGITLIVTLISSISKFYIPDQNNFILPKYIKTILYSLLITSIIYIFFGPFILRLIHTL